MGTLVIVGRSIWYPREVTTVADPERGTTPDADPAEALPFARVAVAVTPPHLDRLFDYLVPPELAEQAQPGVRVRVRFSGRLVDGFLLERTATSEHTGKLGRIEKVVSAEPALSAEIATLARTVADRYAGTLGDVLRLAVPPRHARAEKAVLDAAAKAVPPDTGATDDSSGQVGAATAQSADSPAAAEPGSAPVATPATGSVQESPAEPASTVGWAAYPAGPAFLNAVDRGVAARAVWQLLPGEDWPTRLAEAATRALAAGRGMLVVVPDVTELARLDQALTAGLPKGSHLTLTADLGPETRYRRFLQIRRGEVKVVAGTRAAAFAPVADLGLAVIVDDGDDHHDEPRAPYPHAREVLMLRSVQTGCALVVAGTSRTAEAALLVRSGWAREIVADRATVRSRMPRIEGAGDEYAVGADSAASRARLSPAAFRAARESLDRGRPVLVQVPRLGYLPGLACARCRRPASCRHCHGPLALIGRDQPPRCRWCGVVELRPVCGACGSTDLRATTVGTRRTAEELGRAFPGARTITSAGDSILASLEAAPTLVVATPGAEPVVDGGYGAALLLDGSALLARPDLRASETALRRWFSAATLVQSAREGGRVVVGADRGLSPVQALIRWDPAGHAAAELEQRDELGFPPSVAMASLQGDDQAVTAALNLLELPPEVEILGPAPLMDLPGGHRSDDPDQVRALVRGPQRHRKELTAELARVTRLRSTQRGTTPARVQIDPEELF